MAFFKNLFDSFIGSRPTEVSSSEKLLAKKASGFPIEESLATRSIPALREEPDFPSDEPFIKPNPISLKSAFPTEASLNIQPSLVSSKDVDFLIEESLSIKSDATDPEDFPTKESFAIETAPMIPNNPQFDQEIEDYNITRDPSNDSCTLFYVVNTGDIDFVTYYIDKLKQQGELEAKLECTGNARGTSLGIAVYNQDVEIVDLLLQEGADANNQGETETLPLYDAVKNNNIELINLLTAHGATEHLWVYDLPADILSPKNVSTLSALIRSDSFKKITADLLRFAVETRNFLAIQSILNLGIDPRLSFAENELSGLLELSESIRVNASEQLNARITALLIKFSTDAACCDDEPLTHLKRKFVETARLVLKEELGIG
ncbi:MAG: ankyrin repeat domain-containing protein [Thiotrichaceae bacterium]|nr:ankyrin repeat domain-containing protein [Thiotrichaceae bacterium]